MKRAITILILLCVTGVSAGCKYYREHQEAERGKRNLAKYYTLSFLPCVDTCSPSEPVGNMANYDCVTDVHFLPSGSAQFVLISYTDQMGIHTVEKAALMPQPMVTHNGAYMDRNGNAKWCE